MKYNTILIQVATDPVLAWQKAKELYASLSQPEPENQARPATLEELVVLLTRETARKVVHLVNYTHNDLPRWAINFKNVLLLCFFYIAKCDRQADDPINGEW